jgi:hypothetical protein
MEQIERAADTWEALEIEDRVRYLRKAGLSIFLAQYELIEIEDRGNLAVLLTENPKANS